VGRDERMEGGEENVGLMPREAGRRKGEERRGGRREGGAA
jgi:hypothetical protein